MLSSRSAATTIRPTEGTRRGYGGGSLRRYLCKMSETELSASHVGPRFLRLHLTNFLSYRSAVLELSDLVALVGPNASGKSNAVAAIKLLREIPFHGLATAIARRGGFDQLRHRSEGHPYNPAIRLDFRFSGCRESFYELKLGAVAGKRYEVKHEHAVVHLDEGQASFTHTAGRIEWHQKMEWGTEENPSDRAIRVPQGQSAVTGGGYAYAGYVVSDVLQTMQTVEINPARVGDLQEPSSTREFEPDGSNTASIYETLGTQSRRELLDELSAIVPGLDRIELRRLADKVTLAFVQRTGKGESRREFLAKQMSDGTLRAFSILLSMLQPSRPALVVIEEPEIAIHLGALRTLVDILQQQSLESQILITTHSADIVDTLDVESLRVVWSSDGASHIAPVAEHTLEPIRRGLITPGALLRSDSLDPAIV